MAWSLLYLCLFLLAALLAAAWYSRGQVATTGLVDGRLRGCPATPNCVCSEPGSAGGAQQVAPLPLAGIAAEQAWASLQQVVVAAGGSLETNGSDYLAATFRTRWLGFADDLEARLDPEAGVIHLRSASRVGHSDFGANRRRVAELARAYSAQLESGRPR